MLFTTQIKQRTLLASSTKIKRTPLNLKKDQKTFYTEKQRISWAMRYMFCIF